MSGGEIAALIAALGFVALVAFLGMMLVKLYGVLASTQALIQDLNKTTVPLLEELRETVTTVNVEMERIDGIVAAAESAATSVSNVAKLVSAATSSPIIKGLAFLAGTGATARAFRKRKRE